MKTFSRILNLIRRSNTFESGDAPSADVVTYFQAGLAIPTPNPATFSSDPAQNGVGGATMTASLATGLGQIEYFFKCRETPQFDSGWQTSRIYAPTGLTSGSDYNFSCQSRNQSHAVTRPSAYKSVTVL